MKRLFLSLCFAFAMTLLSFSGASAETETVFYGISYDNINWSMSFIEVDTTGWAKAYVNGGYPVWVFGSDVTAAAMEEMAADVAEEGLEGNSICKCMYQGADAGTCPCGGYCMYGMQNATCTSIIVH